MRKYVNCRVKEGMKVKKGLVKVLVLLLIFMGLLSLAAVHLEEKGDLLQTVGIVSERRLIPGGQSVGVRMDVKGVLVTGIEEIETEGGVVSPGMDCGIETGDMIISVDQVPVYNAGDVAAIVDGCGGEALRLEVLRKNQRLYFDITPAKDLSSRKLKLGVWVKEKIAGIGTLTFYDPETNTLAALGHGIYETQTGILLGVGKGTMMRTEVKSVEEGTAGRPGQIRGIFYADEAPIGRLKKNSVYGMYSECLSRDFLGEGKAMSVGKKEQVETGPAYILTTLEGSRVERFVIEIVEINSQEEPAQKSFEIEVVDERLLKRSGGIVQGMSGSPIIQNDRIIGAITHVFVDNPQKGYGIFVEWMLKECE